MRQMVKTGAFVLQQNAINAVQRDRLDDMDRTMQDTGMRVPTHSTTFNASSSSSSTAPPNDLDHPPPSRQAVSRKVLQNRSNGRFSPTLRISLPRWFTNRVWEIGTYDVGLDNVHSLPLRSINLRPHNSLVFEAVRAGDVEGVQKLLAYKHLSIMDHAYREDEGFPDLNLLMVSRSHADNPSSQSLTHNDRWQLSLDTRASATFYSRRTRTFERTLCYNLRCCTIFEARTSGTTKLSPARRMLCTSFS